MKQLTHLSDLDYKTITRTAYSDNKLFLFFDESFAVIRKCYFDDDDVEVMSETFDIAPNNYNAKELLKLGLITQEKADEIRLAYYKENDELVKQNELKLLQALKEKYPNN
jgi:hypothetical protein